MAEEVFGEAFAAGVVVGGDGLFAAIVDVESRVFPGKEVGELGGADEFGVEEGVEEAVAASLPSGRLRRMRKDCTVATVAGRSGPRDLRWCFS